MKEVNIKEQLQLLKRGSVDFLSDEDMEARLKAAAENGTSLLIKAGFDPTAPDLHLGHTVLLQKMRQFQKLGHRVAFFIGDFPALIGDPSGRSQTRPVITNENIRENAETYKEQVFKVLDPEKTEIMFNSSWLGKLNAEDIIKLTAKYNVARMMERDDFRTRFKEGVSISIHEFLYPLMQGYDSVAMNCDVELGGHDQIFNLLVGRHLMKEYGLKPQSVITVPLLVGLDGVKKMSKSLGNYVGINDSPKEIYGKLMSMSDTLMWDYYTLLSDLDLDEIAKLKAEVEAGTKHPKEVKSNFAMEMVSRFHSTKAALSAKANFMKTPVDMIEKSFPSENGKLWIAKVICGCGFAKSNGEARRLIKQGGVYINGQRIENTDLEVDTNTDFELKCGKRRYAKITIN